MFRGGLIIGAIRVKIDKSNLPDEFVFESDFINSTEELNTALGYSETIDAIINKLKILEEKFVRESKIMEEKMNKINQPNVNKCIQDLKKIVEAEKFITNLEFMKDESNVERYLNYVLDHNVISTLEEIFYLVQQVPELSEPMAKCLRTNKRRGQLVDLRVDFSNSSHYSPSAGVYERLSDVPGYGTEWNERCIPDGVTIKRSNQRC